MKSRRRGQGFSCLAAMACLAAGACERPEPAPIIVRDGGACALSAEALRQFMLWQSPVLFWWQLDAHPWRLDPAPPTRRRDQSWLIDQAQIDQAGDADRYRWLSATSPGLQVRVRRHFPNDEDLFHRVRGPSAEMARAFSASTPANAAGCPEALAYAASQKASPVAGEDRRRRPRDRYGEPEEYWFAAHRAVISPNGEEAIVAVDGESGGALIFYRRLPDGSWRTVATAQSWIE